MDSDNFVSNLDGEIDIRDSLVKLWQHKFQIISFTGFVGVITVVIVLMMPNVYTAKAILLPPNSKDAAMASMLQISSIPLLSNTLTGEQELDSMDVLKAHLSTKSNLWNVINKFKLVKHYRIETGLEVT